MEPVQLAAILAGAEVDPDDFRERFWASMALGVVSFAGPFVVAMLVALGPLEWGTKASLIAGTTLSTTSLAVVYAVLVETGLNRARVGKLVMSACFVTDMCTVIALSVIFIKPTVWFPVFLVVSVVLIVLLPRVAPWFFGRYGDRVIEPEIRLVFVILFALMVLGEEAKSQAVLPAFVRSTASTRTSSTAPSSRCWSWSLCSRRSSRPRSRNAGSHRPRPPSIPTTCSHQSRQRS